MFSRLTMTDGSIHLILLEWSLPRLQVERRKWRQHHNAGPSGASILHLT